MFFSYFPVIYFPQGDHKGETEFEALGPSSAVPKGQIFYRMFMNTWKDYYKLTVLT